MYVYFIYILTLRIGNCLMYKDSSLGLRHYRRDSWRFHRIFYWNWSVLRSSYRSIPLVRRIDHHSRLFCHKTRICGRIFDFCKSDGSTDKLEPKKLRMVLKNSRCFEVKCINPNFLYFTLINLKKEHNADHTVIEMDAKLSLAYTESLLIQNARIFCEYINSISSLYPLRDFRSSCT